MQAAFKEFKESEESEPEREEGLLCQQQQQQLLQPKFICIKGNKGNKGDSQVSHSAERKAAGPAAASKAFALDH
jgi:hypothetical protein